MNVPRALLAAGVLLLVCAAPGRANISRCSWDLACTCIDWSFNTGTHIEVRCPDDSGGWIERPATPPTTQPPIVDDTGSWVGTGNITTTILKGAPLSQETMTLFTPAKTIALSKLWNDYECKQLFKNSPLTDNGHWLAGRVQWRDGTGVPHASGSVPCNAPGTVAWVESATEHRLQAFICPDLFRSLLPDEAAVVFIHEVMHIAGQGEHATPFPANPDRHPNTHSISRAIADACGLQW